MPADRWQGLDAEIARVYAAGEPLHPALRIALRRAYEAGARAARARIAQRFDPYDPGLADMIRSFALPDPEAPDAG